MSLRSLFCVALTVLLGACVGPPEDIDAVPRFDRDTFPGQVQERGILKVAIPALDQKPLSFADPTDLEVRGFIVDLSEELGRALGIEVEYVPVDREDLVDLGDARADPDDGAYPEYDISFPVESISERLARENALTNPYFVSHQRILARSGSAIGTVEDLSGERVCSVIDDEIGVALDELEPAIDLVESTGEGCAELLRRGDVVAATGRDTTLMAIWSGLDPCLPDCGPRPLEYRIAGEKITTEGLGAALPSGTSGWGTIVNATWGEMELEGRWSESYERWIEPYLLESLDPPEMTLREAAGLYPSGV